MCDNFSERTDDLAHQLRCSLRDLAGKIGISQAMLFAYRSGKSEPTLKALRKLESAERAAGIGAAAEAVVPVVVPPPGRLGEIRAQLASLQAEISTLGDFSYQELQARLSAAGAWPPGVQDIQLTPAQLWQKYPPA